MFTHLHVHSHYSMLDGLPSPEQIVLRAKELGQSAVALTDHGNMCGIFEFYKKGIEHGIKPILGYEAYVAAGNDRFFKSAKKGEKSSYHITLLAKNNIGYQNLIKLSTLAYTEGFYYKPRIDYKLLGQHSEGIICMSSCMSGEIPQCILNNCAIGAQSIIQWLSDCFKGDFYLEVQDHGIPEQKTINNWIYDWTKNNIVATNDTHYCNASDAKAHEIMLAISVNKHIYRPDAFRFSTNEFYMKSEPEMLQLFPRHAIETTQEIVDKCNVTLEMGKKHPIVSQEDAFSYLKNRCESQIYRFPSSYEERYLHEMEAIRKTGYAEYLYVVADFISYAKAMGIPVGAGRGSSAGSLVCYLLGITEIDPIEYGLLFERFINIERIAPPDIDVDVCQLRRGEIIDYLKAAYGDDNVAQLITFGTLKAKAAVKDLCRALNVSFDAASKLTKIIGNHFEGDVAELMGNRAFIKGLEGMLNTQQYNDFMYALPRIEGKLRTSSTHAAGVVIAREKLINILPLQKKVTSDDILTQYDMNCVEDIGLLKFDVLGLRTLTIIQDTCNAIDIRPQEITLEDTYTYEMLRRGETFGVFQYEGWGYTKFIKRIQPTEFAHLIDLGALFRPGPLNSGMAETYIARMRSGERDYDVKLSEILIDTYGVILYQEQVMMICQKIAGFTMNEADAMRKAIGKKDKSLMDEVIAQFKFSAINMMGNSVEYVEDLVGRLVTFARYGWNKAHAVSYALLSYQTAYLKYNHCTPYFCSLANAYIADNDRLSKIYKEAGRYGVILQSANVNISEVQHVVHNGTIYRGLRSLKGIGSKSCEAIILERNANGEFTSVEDFRSRIAPKLVNKCAFQTLIDGGAF